MIKLIKVAYKVSKDFIFYRMRYQVPDTFLAAITAQNVFLSKSRVVPIEGINADMMSELRPKLLQLIGVKDVLPHWKTTSEGRWSVLTEDKNFSPLVKYLAENLDAMAERHSSYSYSKLDNNPDDYPSIRVCTKAYSDEESDTDNSYYSNCTDAYSIYNDPASDYGSPPVASVQAWGKPAPKIIQELDVTTVGPTQVDDTSHSVNESELIRLRAENKQQQDLITVIEKQFAEKLAAMQLAIDTLTAPPPVPVAGTTTSIEDRFNALEDQFQRFMDFTESQYGNLPNPPRIDRSRNPRTPPNVDDNQAEPPNTPGDRSGSPPPIGDNSTRNLSTPPRVAGAKRQNTNNTPPPFKGASTEVALL